MEKRFQECDWRERLWRYRWYLMIPLWWGRSMICHGGHKQPLLVWRLLIGEAQIKMNWVYTSKEVWRRLETKIKEWREENEV